jgi:hypothetical protein
MTIIEVKTGTLGEFNVGLAAAVGLLVPLSAQIDALLTIGLGPFQADLMLQFNAALAAQATLTIQVGDPFAALQLAISALAQLQAALQLALQFPPINISISAELSASIALAGALSARLGLLSIAIELAIQIKLAALKLAAELQLSLSAGPVTAVAFGGESYTVEGSKLALLLNGGTVDGKSITGLNPADVAYGVLLVTSVPSVSAAISAIIQV